MTSFRLTREAAGEIRSILLYLESGNPVAARTWLEELRTKLGLLSRFPRMGRVRPDLLPDVWMFPFGNHAIFYDIEKGGILVLHVADARRDVASLFQGEDR